MTSFLSIIIFLFLNYYIFVYFQKIRGYLKKTFEIEKKNNKSDSFRAEIEMRGGICTYLFVANSVIA